ncbi:MAG: tripartite tricarboxylate transporter substrate binding protein [Burkholderiaceae bacterium]
MKMPIAFVVLSLALSGALLAAPSEAAGFPERTVTVMVPYPAGGGTDTLARLLAKSLSDYWKVPVVVENAGGAEGQIGTQKVLNAPADGYTLLFQISQMLLWKKTVATNKIDVLKDFRYVSKIQTSPLAFGVSTKHPAKSWAEFVTWCKAEASKGCSWGAGSAYAQLIGKQLMDEAGLKESVSIPYRGTAPMMTDVLGGHIAMAVPAVTSSLAQVKGGNYRILAVGSDDRSAHVPDVPTLKELGYPVHGETWYGLLVAKNTPQAAFDEIVKAVAFASKSDALRAQIRQEGGEPIFSTPEVFQQQVEQESKVLDAVLDKYWVPAK